MKFRLFLVFLSFFALAGCKQIEVEDGIVPAEIQEQVQEWTGFYKGEFDGWPIDLRLQMESNGALILEIANSTTGDLLSDRCKSDIGELKSITVSGRKEVQIDGAKFYFNPNNCKFRVEGRELSLSFYKKDEQNFFHLSLVGEIRYVQDCRWVSGGVDSQGRPYPPRRICDTKRVVDQIKGRFRQLLD